MKKPTIFLLLLMSLLTINSTAQSTTKTKTTTTKSKPNIEINVEKKVEINIFGGDNSNTKTTTTTYTKNGNKGANTKENNTNNSSSSTPTNSIKAYSKYDFIQGEKVVAIEDFQQTNIGDFPLRWNTNGSAEVVTLSGRDGKWLQLGTKTTMLPEFIKNLPENFTFEFDLACSQPFSFYTQELFIGFVAMQKPATDFTKWTTFKRGESGFIFGIHPAYLTSKTQGTSDYKIISASKEVMKNKTIHAQFNHVAKPIVHVAIWRQNDRIRLYLNEEKIWDLPKAFADTKFNGIVFYSGAVKTENDKYYIANLRLTVGASDTRNKLIDEGKFSTTGILFDVNSDKIKPASYGILKEIATTLNENENVSIKIVGHTDSDGDDASNLSLSKKRADAVKSFLNKEFDVDNKRMETDGKGEMQPVDKSISTEGKANNRRVEFIKL